MAVLYEAKGIAPETARMMAADLISNAQKALATKAREELGIAEEAATRLREGWVTGLAIAFGAIIPVAPFFLLDHSATIWASFAISMLSHFGVGAARTIVTGRGIFRSGLDMLMVGLGVAVVGYLVGDLVARLVA